MRGSRRALSSSRAACLTISVVTLALAACSGPSSAGTGNRSTGSASPPASSSSSASASTTASSSPSITASVSASPSASPTSAASTAANPFFNGALQFAISEAERKTGLSYAANGCASGQSCLSNAIETDGENATYISLSASGYSGGTNCYVYVYRDPLLGWQDFATLCGSEPGFSPVYGQTEPVRVSGVCANVRSGPGLSEPVVGCLPNGTLVKINATPTYSGGKMWWGVASQSVAGMMSQEFLVKA